MASARTATLVKKDGVVTCTPSLESLVSLCGNGEYVVTLKRKSSPRTVSQNALMWMWLQCIEYETGNDKQDLHDWYCCRFLQREITLGGNTVRVVGRTSALDTAEMTRFMNKIQAHAATELGIMLPLPEDRYYNEFYENYKN